MRPEGVLFEIAERVARGMETRRAEVSAARLYETLSKTRIPRDFTAPFLRPERMPVIAEVKLASPSEGDLAPKADPVEIAREYLDAGAVALSVLTEQSTFKGSPEYLRRIRAQFPDALILKKDFILDEYQLFEARHEGADAVLLILALLGAEKLATLQARATELGLTSLVEVHGSAELDEAVSIGARMIGVNNRDLKTLKISLDVSRELATSLPSDTIVISESGITRGEELEELLALGYRGVLVGSALMRSGAPGAALSALIGRPQ